MGIHQRCDFFHRPDVIAHTGFHRWRHAQHLMDAPEVVVHIVECHGVGMILGFLGKPVGEAGEPSHAPPPAKVLSFNVAGRDVRRIGRPLDTTGLGSESFRWAVSTILKRLIQI